MDPAKIYSPRVCILENDGTGYGFNLECERGKFGQYVRNIRPGSAADRSGLRLNDRIIEVNGKNVENDNHQQVVSKIKEDDARVTMLVIDNESDAYFTKRGIAISSALLKGFADSQREANNNAQEDEQNSLHDKHTAEKSLDGSLNEFGNSKINNLNAASTNHHIAGLNDNGHANVSQSNMQFANEVAITQQTGPITQTAATPERTSTNNTHISADEPDYRTPPSFQKPSIDQVRAQLNMKRGEKMAAKQNKMTFQQKSAVFDSL